MMTATGELPLGDAVEDNQDRTPHLEQVVDALRAAGIEIYRAEDATVQLAERIRVHLMDSGVTVHVAPALQVAYAVRCQRSDFPSDGAEAMFQRVRNARGTQAEAAGFVETSAQPREITDPMDDARVLDVWYEVTYARAVPTLPRLVEVATWALRQGKCVDPA